MAVKEPCVTKRDCDTRFTAFMEELKEVREDIKNISVSIAELPEKLWAKADERYAPKWVADILKALIGLGLTAIVVALLKLVIVD
jgi:hypothetical protein